MYLHTCSYLAAACSVTGGRVRGIALLCNIAPSKSLPEPIIVPPVSHGRGPVKESSQSTQPQRLEYGERQVPGYSTQEGLLYLGKVL
jgi:hypothetical protein